MTILQTAIRPFRPRLIETTTKSPAGSQPLSPPKSLYKICAITERRVGDLYLYDITTKPRVKTLVNSADDLTKLNVVQNRVLYFAGGGFQAPPSPSHWKFLAELVTKQLPPNSVVSLISYPLAPKSPASVSFPATVRAYEELLRLAKEKGEQIIVMGDSAGGNMGVGIVMDVLKKHVSNNGVSEKDDAGTGAHAPKAIFLISPSVDLTRSNPEMKKLEAVDPLFTLASTRGTAAAWCNPEDGTRDEKDTDWTAHDPRLSPIFAPDSWLDLLRSNEIAVHGILGTYDMLSCDALKFKRRLEERGVKGEWLSAEKQMHCYLLAMNYFVFKECKDGMQWAGKVLRGSFEGN